MQALLKGLLSMFPFSVRIIIVLLCLVASILRLTEGNQSWVLYLAAGFIFTYEHFKGGSIWLAFQAYRKGKPEWVRKFLQNTRKPELLRTSSKSYYYYLSAVVNTVDQNLNGAKDNLLIAIKLPFATEHMRCMAHWFLAEVYLDLGELKEGKKIFEVATNIPHRPELDSHLKRLEERISEIA